MGGATPSTASPGDLGGGGRERCLEMARIILILSITTSYLPENTGKWLAPSFFKLERHMDAEGKTISHLLPDLLAEGASSERHPFSHASSKPRMFPFR